MSVIKANGAGEVSTGFYNGVISRSLRFDATSSTRLESPTFSSDGGDTWTWSAWVKFHDLSKAKQVLFGRSGNNACFIYNDGGTGEGELDLNDDGAVVRRSTGFFRDVSNWYHVTLNGNGTVNRLWVNGVEVNFASTANIGKLNEAVQHQIGDSANFSGDFHADISIADVNFVSGTALDYSAFAEFKEGVLIPIEPSVTYGGNGFRLQFLQTGSNADANGIGADTSGNNNHFTATNLNSHDVITDCPENNFCTINDRFADATANTIDEGGLKVTTSTAGRSFSPGTFLMTSGKWYFEFKVDENSGGMGVAKVNGANGAGAYRSVTSTGTGANTSDYYYGETNFIYYQHKIRHNGSVVTSLSGSEPSDLIYGVAVDMDASPPTITYYVDGSSVGSADLDTGFDYIPIAGDGSGGVSRIIHVNFGQNPTFSGEETAGTNTDGNGNGLFHDAVPSGHLALCASSLPDPSLSANANEQSDDHFNTVLYTSDNIGAGGTQNVTGVGFQPDWVWLKNRDSGSTSHTLYDSNRGTGRHISSDSSSAEVGLNSIYGYLSAFGVDGYTLTGGTSNANYVNQGTDKYVSWNWKANGGTTSSNSDGTITSTVQANQTAGFSIIQYAGTGSALSYGHGLTERPTFYIVKDRDNSNAWFIQFFDGSSDYYLGFSTASATSLSGFTPDATKMNYGGSSTLINQSSVNYIVYAFHSVEGYSKIGTYNAGGSGTEFIYTGFRPQWLLIKEYSSGGTNWILFDDKRTGLNEIDDTAIAADTSQAEAFSSGHEVDFYSNGFKITGTNNDVSYSGSKHLYICFAKQPFKFSNPR
jgi:hypothetical protein